MFYTPEMLREDYPRYQLGPAQMWQVGILTYVLLVGKFPFELGATVEERLKMEADIKEGNF